MRSLFLFGFVALSALVSSCKKEVSLEKGENPITIDANWEFTTDGITFRGVMDEAFLAEQPGIQVLTMEGSQNDGGSGMIILHILSENIRKETYTSPNAHFRYIENGNIVYQNVPRDADFVLTVEYIDSVSISGRFVGMVQDVNGNIIPLTNGKFTAAVKGLAGENGEDPQPEPGYFPLAKSWTYQNWEDPGERLVITATGTQEIDGKTYTVFENGRTQAKRYFREGDDGQYYEHITFDFGTPAPGAPTLEVMILDTNAVVGDRWETGPFIVGTGPSVQVNIVHEVVSKGESFNLGGIVYDDVIEIETRVFVDTGSGFEEFFSLGFFTSYARGYGIIFFVDKTDSSRWSLESFSRN